VAGSDSSTNLSGGVGDKINVITFILALWHIKSNVEILSLWCSQPIAVMIVLGVLLVDRKSAKKRTDQAFICRSHWIRMLLTLPTPIVFG